MATLNELKTMLTERGILFSEDAKKSELEGLLANPPDPAPDPDPDPDDFPTENEAITLTEDVAASVLPKGHKIVAPEPIPSQPSLAELNRDARAAWKNVEKEKLRKIVADAQKILEKNPGLMED